jgi:FkbM family methyltransferase
MRFVTRGRAQLEMKCEVLKLKCEESETKRAELEMKCEESETKRAELEMKYSELIHKFNEFGMASALLGLKARKYAPEIIFDIGAAAGIWTRTACDIWPNAKIYCFEPLAERERELAAVSAEYPDHVTHISVGLGDRDMIGKMGVTSALWDSSFAYDGPEMRDLPVRSLDSLFAEGVIPQPSFVKIDAQGFERKIIEGGPITLEHTEAMILECSFFPFCSTMSTLDEMIAFMRERNFQPYEFVDFLRRPLDGAMGQCDILFIKRDHPLVADTRW